MAATVRGKLYLYGGTMFSDGGDVLSSELWELTLPGLQPSRPVWRDLSTIVTAPKLPLAGHALVSSGATLLLIGGDTGQAVSDNFVYALDTLAAPNLAWEKISSTPGAASTFQAVGSVGDVLVVYGGSIKGAVQDDTLYIVDVRSH
jgi:N-acetylneuraminic acid mutarotase